METFPWLAMIAPLIIGFVLIYAVFNFGRWSWLQWHETIIYPYQQGLHYKDGQLNGLLTSGRHRYFGKRSRIDVHDVRKQALSVNGQEILTKDNVSLRVTLVGYYQIVDLELAERLSSSYVSDIYSLAQLALRKAVGGVTVDEFLAEKSQLDESIMTTLAQKGEALGLSITDVAVLDVMLPANLKKAYSGVLEAQKEAQKNLEKARGEQAVLRSLANSAKLYQENPSLLQARVIQALATGNNSIVFGSDDKIAIKNPK
jgi:regulator of protease activity HflC (stomatin/prohibitin superfamily)